ncbi:uncharacterized protein LOC141655193 [Silene latifolia]|uniref:uncharacterized protein LOC141655193 n=1 Tax=Silene latifolia TaxID=37657 RepID=UPI003D78AADD
MITCGSDLSGLTYSAAKRHATETKGDRPANSCRISHSDLPAVAFDEGDICDEREYHDALIIILSMANCTVKKVLVDTGSSVNLIMLKTIENMGFSEKDLQKKTIPLVGFSGEITNSLGELVIPTYVGGVNKQISMDCFAWSHDDMIGIDPSIITHKLSVDPKHKPIQQRRRKFAAERNKVINQEVDSLLAAKKIREVKYPKWLSNVVVVPKKNGKWIVCVDFTDLNKACPKDPFPLPHIDAMVDATIGHEMLTFLNAWSGYNQIKMDPAD